MIRVTPDISLDDDEVEETFVRSSGPGGQNVNKVSTAVQVRFNARTSPNLPNDVSIRLQRLAGARLTREGVIVLTADRHRSQERNRADALDRLISLIREAAYRPPPRRPTRPSKAAKARRVEGKKHRGTIKGLRGKPLKD